MRPTALALAACFALALPAAAQDVVEQGRAYGVEPPAWVREALAGQPDAFEFRRAWRQKVEAVRAQRARLERQGFGPLLSVEALQATGAAVTGTLRVPVIAGVYSDAAAPYSRADYQARLFGEPATGYSARTFYREMSRGVFEVDGTVTEWIVLPQAASYYQPTSASSDRYGKTGEFLRDALLGADGAMDFGRFDNDGPDGIPNSGDDDGYVDAAAFIYPTHGKSCGGPGIWPHRWVYRAHFGAPFTTNDPRTGGGFILVDDYLIQDGVDCDGTSLMPIGTFSHELGHALALPDLYDTQSGGPGVGEWDLMGSGSWRRQHSPAHMGAWSKDFLGWLSVETVTASRGSLTLAPVYDAGRVLRYDVPFTREYFLLEHRRAHGSDQYLHAPGLLVYHVDPVVVDANRFQNRVNAGPVHGVAVEEADGLGHLRARVNRGDAGDPFPGATGKTAFGRATTPSSRSNSGTSSGLELGSLAYAGGTLTFALEVTEAGDLLASGVPVPDLAGAHRSEMLFRVVVPPEATRLHLASTGGTGDMDLRADPRTPDAWTGGTACASEGGTSEEGCTIDDPAAGTWYVMLYGYTAYSGVTLEATLTSPRLVGDLSGDGAVTAQDALGVLSSLVGRALPAGWNAAVGGDADCDGEVTAVDALIILSRVVGKDVSQFCIGTVR
jgi:M6 family metalloprotease-like protein